MVSKEVSKEIDKAVKEVWLKDISSDYENYSLLKEDALKCSLYHHLRENLDDILLDNNLRIYPEYYLPGLKYKADLAIVEIDPDNIKPKLKDMVTDVVAIFELKFDYSPSENTRNVIRSDVEKLKRYLDSGIKGKYYFSCIYENSKELADWFNGSDVESWGKGIVTELSAALEDGFMEFEVKDY